MNVSFNTLKAIYFVIFDSHINYAKLIWGQNPKSKLRVTTLQKKALRIRNNQPKSSHSGPLFKQNNILKFEDKIQFGNIIFVSKSINNLLPPIGLYSVLKFTTITQSHRQLINYLSLRIELTLMVKAL